MKNILKTVFMLVCGIICVAFFSYLKADDFSTITSVKFPTGQGITDREKTIRSLSKVEGAYGLYAMTFYGDYDDIVEKTNKDLQNKLKQESTKRKCSLISLTEDKNNPIYGRNFDNVDGGMLITLYRHPNKYDSIAFSPTNDFDLPKDFQPDKLSDDAKQKILCSAFLSTCGMNEKGVVTALASTASSPIINENGLRTVFVTQWIREILDNAGDVNEAITICKKLRAYDYLNTTSHHILITDAKGNSVIVEYFKGDWRFIYDTKPWQVVTNMPLYNMSLEASKKCWRYKRAYNMLEKINGGGTWEDAMKTLKAVSVTGDQAMTLWSFVADIADRTLYVCINREYDKVYKFSF